MGGSLTRRRFLRGAGIVAGAAAISTVPGIATASRAGLRKVYRLSWRGQFCCNACKAHDANRFYFNQPTANRDRPHVGCNCKVVTQWIPQATHQRYFGNGITLRKVFDQRWG